MPFITSVAVDYHARRLAFRPPVAALAEASASSRIVALQRKRAARLTGLRDQRSRRIRLRSRSVCQSIRPIGEKQSSAKRPLFINQSAREKKLVFAMNSRAAASLACWAKATPPTANP